MQAGRAVAQPVLVGRQKEMEFLKTRLDQASARRAALVIIAGEAGVGKSRLSEEFGKLAAEKGYRVAIGRCVPGASIPYMVFRDALRGALPRKIGGKARSASEDTTLQKTGLIRWIKGPIEYLESTEVLATQDESYFLSVLEFLRTLSARLLLVLILEDLQWSDSASLQLLHFIARNMEGLRLLIVATYRSEDLAGVSAGVHLLQEALRVMRREDICHELPLDALNAGEIRLAIESMLGGPIDSELLHRIASESEGNPLFAVEAVRMLVDADAIVRKNGMWQAVPQLTLEIPSTVKEVILRRVERLSENDRRVVDCASIVGETFDPSLLEEALGLKRLRLLETLASIQRGSQLIREGEGVYRFSHENIQRVVYEQVPNPLKRELHKAIAQELERRTPPEDLHGGLSFHFLHAGMTPECIKHSLLAGRDCARKFALSEAAVFYERVVSSAKDDSRFLSERLEALEGLGETSAGLGRLRTGETYYRTCLENTQSSPDRARLLRKLAEITEDNRKAAELLTEAERSAGIEPVELGRIKRIRGAIAREEGRANDAEQFYDEAEQIFRQLKANADLARTLLNNALLLETNGMVQAAIAKAEEASKLYSTVESLEEQVRTYDFLSTLYFWLGRREKATEYRHKERELGAKLRNYSVLYDSHFWMGLMFYYYDEFDSSIREFLKGREFGQYIEGYSGFTLNGWLSRSESRMGRLVEAEKLVRENLAIVKKLGSDEFLISRVSFDEAELLAAQGKWAESVDKYLRCLEFNPPNIYQQIFATIVHIRLAQALLKLKRKEEARQQLNEAKRTFVKFGNEWGVETVAKLFAETN